MTRSGCNGSMRLLRRLVVQLYRMLILTSLGTTAIRSLRCDSVSSTADSEECLPRRDLGSPDSSWKDQDMYGVTSSTTDASQGPSVVDTDQFRRSDNISGTCVGSHGLEVQQDNTTGYLRGLPIFHVSVVNTCLDCALRDIHIACGAWASATAVNPLLFKRVANNDCVVNNGKPLNSQQSIYFEYTNSFPYPMNVQRVIPSCA